MKIIYATDLHGDRVKYDRLLALARDQRPDALINGGDLLPKRGNRNEQARFINGFFFDHLKALSEMGIPCLFMPGNDDQRIFDPDLEAICAGLAGVQRLDGRVVALGAYEFIGFNWVCDYPFRLKDRCLRDEHDSAFPPQLGSALFSTPEGYEEIFDWPTYARTLPTMGEELAWLPRPQDPDRAVYVIHDPPAGLGLDVCHGERRVGSVSVARFIEHHQPRLTLHGHIHESPEVSGVWQSRIDRTVCVNPGQLEMGLVWLEIDLESMSLRRQLESATSIPLSDQ